LDTFYTKKKTKKQKQKQKTKTKKITQSEAYPDLDIMADLGNLNRAK
jgi:hypothetical protein